MYRHEQTAKGPKEQGKIIAQMNGSTNYTVSCQSSRWKLERDDIKHYSTTN
jgi:hypothetical protein